MVQGYNYGMHVEYPTLYWVVIVNQTSVLTVSPHQSTQLYCGWQWKKEIWHSHLIPLSNYAPIWIRSVCLSTETDAEPFVRNINLLIIFLTFIFHIHWRVENLGFSSLLCSGRYKFLSNAFLLYQYCWLKSWKITVMYHRKISKN